MEKVYREELYKEFLKINDTEIEKIFRSVFETIITNEFRLEDEMLLIIEQLKSLNKIPNKSRNMFKCACALLKIKEKNKLLMAKRTLVIASLYSKVNMTNLNLNDILILSNVCLGLTSDELEWLKPIILNKSIWEKINNETCYENSEKTLNVIVNRWIEINQNQEALVKEDSKRKEKRLYENRRF